MKILPPRVPPTAARALPMATTNADMRLGLIPCMRAPSRFWAEAVIARPYLVLLRKVYRARVSSRAITIAMTRSRETKTPAIWKEPFQSDGSCFVPLLNASMTAVCRMRLSPVVTQTYERNIP